MLSIQVDTKSLELIIYHQFDNIKLSFFTSHYVRLIDAVRLLDTLQQQLNIMAWAYLGLPKKKLLLLQQELRLYDSSKQRKQFLSCCSSRSLPRLLAQLLLLPGMNYRKLLFTLLHSKDNSTKKLTKAVRNFLTWTTVKEYNVVLQGKVIKIMSKSPSSSNHHKYKSKLSTGSFKGKFTYQDPATHHTVLVLP